jgi:hypothetical protein
MARRAILLSAALCLALPATALAQTAAEAGAAHSTSAGAGSSAKDLGGALGSALGRIGGNVESSTTTTTPAAPAKRTRTQPAPSTTPAASNSPTQPGVFGPPPQIRFDVVSFKRCAAAPSSAASPSSALDLPADGDSVADHCQPLSRLLTFAYTGATPSSLSGYPTWVSTDLYDFEAKVAEEDLANWQRMNLTARRAALRVLLTRELKLKVHADTTPTPSDPSAHTIIVDHIELPATN